MPPRNATASKPASATTRPAGRRPGRPAGPDSGTLDRATVLAVALELAKTVPLSQLSVVYVARELGVTPGLIHYYVGGRGPLTSGVMSAFWMQVVTQWPATTGQWREDLEKVSHALFEALLRYPGIANYFATHDRYRMVQEVGEDEIDNGLVFFEKFTNAVRAAGFDPARTSVYGNLLLEFIGAYAHRTVSHRWPDQHSDFLNQKLQKLDTKAYPGIHYIRESLVAMNAQDAFNMSLQLLLQALAAEREGVAKGGARNAKARRDS